MSDVPDADAGPEVVSWSDLCVGFRAEGRKAVMAQKDELEIKLRWWGESALADKLAECCQPVLLGCTSCGERSDGFKSCKRRWCPVCARRKSAERVEKFQQVTKGFQWPMHVTLTRVNDYTLTSDRIKAFTKAFAKFRRRKVWKNCTKGGISALEITNKGHGWHVHGHALVDCEWMGNKVKPPQRGSSRDHKAVIYQAAAAEFGAIWAKVLGQEHASVKIRRCDVDQVIKEVLKYAVKPSDLIDFPENPATLIRAIESCRMLSTFGHCWGFKFTKSEREKTACPCCGLDSPCVPIEVLAMREPELAGDLERGREARESKARRQATKDYETRRKQLWEKLEQQRRDITPTSRPKTVRPQLRPKTAPGIA